MALPKMKPGEKSKILREPANRQAPDGFSRLLPF